MKRILPMLFLIASLGTGCAETTVLPNLSLLGEARPYLYTDRDWAAVLREHVRYGLVDYQGLASNREPLDRYYALLSVTGPKRTPDLFPSQAHVTAYYINAYNALVLCAVLSRFPVETMYDLSLPRLEYGYSFRLDGRPCTLAMIEAELLKESQGDIRVLLATSRAAKGAPWLPNEPVRPRMLEVQLNQAAADALDSSDLLRIDHASQSILVWQLILRRQDEIVSYWKARRRVRTAYLFNVLLDLASSQRRRALQSAVGYGFKPIPFDRSLNNWTPKAGESTIP